MKILTFCFLAVLSALMMESCAYQAGVVGGMYFYTGGTGVSGLVLITNAGSVDVIPPSGKVIVLPPEVRSAHFYYFAPFTEGTYEVMEWWFLDGRSVKEERREDNNGNFTGWSFDNKKDGEHEIVLVVYWAYTGSNQSAGTTRYRVRVRTGH